ncbi:MAG: HEAT repeat domain-containing protein [Chloroflexota bacterium]
MPYFEDSLDLGEPNRCDERECQKLCFQGSVFLGDGFLLSHEEAEAMKKRNRHLNEVIFPVINGKEINNQPDQMPGRQIINFSNWPLEKAKTYGEAFDRVFNLVKPEREKVSRAARRERWWQHAERSVGLYSSIEFLERCFVVTWVSKYLSFSCLPTNYIFTNSLYVFTTDRWDLYAVVQSTLHEVWARKYSGALKQDLRYSPSNCFENFPFPANLWQTANPVLTAIGEQYHEHRRALMRQLWLGLTPIYNLFHDPALTPTLVAKISKQPEEVAEAGYRGLLELRRLHVALDHAIRDAYGWHPSAGSGQGLDLGHDFHEVETLPENDRVRYTISPEARKEVLRRLLAINHQRDAEEAAALKATVAQGKPRKRAGGQGSGDQKSLEAEKVLALKPPPTKPKPQLAPKPDLAAKPTLVTDFTPPQGSFAQRLKRVNAIVQPKNQMELSELIAALGDENGQIRWLAGASLARLADMATVKLLAAYLKTSPAPVAKEEALKVLSLIGEMSEDEGVKEAAKRLT